MKKKNGFMLLMERTAVFGFSFFVGGVVFAVFGALIAGAVAGESNVAAGAVIGGILAFFSAISSAASISPYRSQPQR